MKMKEMKSNRDKFNIKSKGMKGGSSGNGGNKFRLDNKGMKKSK